MAKRGKRVSEGAAIDIGAFGYELAMHRKWKKVRELVREAMDGELAIYDMIYEAGEAFSRAEELEGVSWDSLIWDDELLGYIDRVIAFLVQSDGAVPSKGYLLGMARDQLTRE